MPRKALFLLQDVNLPTFLNLLVSEQVKAFGALLSPCLAAAPVGSGGDTLRSLFCRFLRHQEPPRFLQGPQKPWQEGHGLSRVNRKKSRVTSEG